MVVYTDYKKIYTKNSKKEKHGLFEIHNTDKLLFCAILTNLNY